MSQSTKRVLLTLRALSLIVCMLLCVCSPLIAHADGGAPNLAYVSGTSYGISVVDVGQAKVIRTLNMKGDPHTILLSADGRFLYITQPAAPPQSVLKPDTILLIVFCALLVVVLALIALLVFQLRQMRRQPPRPY